MLLNILLGIIGTQELLIIVPPLIYLWVLIDILRNEFQNNTNKIIWLILFLFIPILLYIIYSSLTDHSNETIYAFAKIVAFVFILSFLIYYFIGKKQQIKKTK